MKSDRQDKIEEGLQSRPYLASLVVESFEGRPCLGGLLGNCGDCFVLGDFSEASDGLVSYFGVGAAEMVCFDQGDAGDPFELLGERLGRFVLNHEGALPVPFVGGWVGFLGYDLGGYVETLPQEAVVDHGFELLRFGFYDHLIAWDHVANTGYLLVLDYVGQRDSVAERLERLRGLLKQSKRELVAKKKNTLETQEMKRNIGREDYLAKVQRAKKYIKAGDIYEVNLSQRFACATEKSAGELYEELVGQNPAAYSALLQWEDKAIVSVSPELFLEQRGREIITRPIKGTKARGNNDKEDEENRQALYDCAKERAELNMIVDLERNDLGRVCEIGSIEVLEERTIEEHPTLFHAVATVRGQVREEVSVAEILRATFPGGSITGAPKIRAMEIIDELEPTARSVYTGSIGWFGVNGDFDLNIAIRTIMMENGRASFQVGGAVVDDSTPLGEYEETLTKAKALARVLGRI